jgi:2-polyprenyl-6-methoxyphenol hydroxylase-like FAD-dependent oxidoreductase
MSGALVPAGAPAERGPVERAPKRYEDRHRPAAEAKQEEGRRTARWFIPRGRVRAAVRDRALRTATFPGVSHLLRHRFLGGAPRPRIGCGPFVPAG